MSGFAAVLKPPGIGSQTLLHRLRRLWGAPGLGHAGTLDPAAAGVLVLADGFARRLLDVAAWDKDYVAEVLFGLATDSGDLEGRVLARSTSETLTEAAVRTALDRFRGRIRQVPPAFSAVKIGGRPSYELARLGRAVEPAARWVTVHAFELLRFEPGPSARARFRLTVSSGTYVRALARDLGEALGVGGCLAALVRTRVGPFHADGATRPSEPPRWTPPHKVLGLPVRRLRAEELRRVRQGQPIAAGTGDEGLALGVAEDETVALLVSHRGQLWPRRVASP